MDMIKRMSKKGSDKEKISEKIIKNPKLLSSVLEGLNAEEAAVKYGCDKVLRIISKKEPILLYPNFNLFVKMLDSENNFLKWGAIIAIGNLTSVDTKNKFEKIFKKYFSVIKGPTMISAANVINAAVIIATSKPAMKERIVKELLKVEKANYKTPECRNIAIGHAINAFSQFYVTIKNKPSVNKFVKKQLDNTRKPVVKKAEKFIKKYKIGL